jgi:hypothetical protein
MNGANLIMPINNEKDYLHYEVPSGGHFCDLGLELFMSSKKMIDVIKLSLIFPTLQFVYSPSSNNYFSSYFDYMDMHFNEKFECINEELKKDILKTLDYLKDAKFKKALQTNFSKMSLVEKINQGLIYDSYHTSIGKESDIFSLNNKLLNTKEALDKLIPLVQNEELDIDNDFNNYIWINNQLHVGVDCYNGDDEPNHYTVPFIAPFMLLSEEYDLSNDDIELYLKNMTKEDKLSFNTIKKTLKQLDIDNPHFE